VGGDGERFGDAGDDAGPIVEENGSGARGALVENENMCGAHGDS
jgi:hypothetical protein